MDEVTIYAVKKAIPLRWIGFRVGELHEGVFHGSIYHIDEPPTKGDAYVDEQGRIARAPFHATRSGAFVPDVFCGGLRLVVSPRVQAALAPLPGVQFEPVVFEHVVDLPMPALGDMSWYESPMFLKYDGDPVSWMRTMPHSPRLAEKLEGYKRLNPVMYSYRKELDRPADTAMVRLCPSKFDQHDDSYLCEISPTMIRKLNVLYYDGSLLVFSKPAFKAIAPYLDLEYYAIEWRVVTVNGR